MKKALAVLLACVLLAGFALAESPESAGNSDLFATLPEESAPEFSGILANDASEGTGHEPTEEEVLPALISITKSSTKTVWLGTAYRFEVPGKAVKSYTSSSRKIATVDKTGLIALKKAGKVKITAKLKNGKKIVLTLKVADPLVPTVVTINEGKKATLTVGDAMRLTAAVSPATAPQNVTWKSGSAAVATVDESGLVRAVRSGTATITATTPNKVKATFALTVRTKPYMISHAMGGIDGYNYSNCLEAFEENYDEGHRVFEVDIQYTSDGKMVLWHDWNKQVCAQHKPGKVPTYDQFMGCRIYDRYTPMSVEDLLRLMDRYPDIRIVTDGRCTTASSAKKQFTTIVNTARKLGTEEALDRFIVEIYNEDMLKSVKSVYPFKEYMFTLYQRFKKAPSKSQLKSVASFCRKNGISTVAMYVKWWKSSYMEILRKYGLDAALYTTNSASDSTKFFNQGVTALFTDFLPPLQNIN